VLAWGLTVAEAVLSPSLFATLSVLFMLVTLIVSIATPLNIYSTQATHSALPNIIWTCFLAYKVISIAIKLALYFAGNRDNMGDELR
jgi:hypothetical protein